MDTLAQRLQQSSRESRVRLGLAAAAVFIGVRLVLVLAILARGVSEYSSGFVATMVLPLLVAGGLTYGLYRRHFWSAVALFLLWATTFGYSWVMSARWMPPLGLIGILVGAGLFQGVLGTSEARKRERSRALGA